MSASRLQQEAEVAGALVLQVILISIPLFDLPPVFWDFFLILFGILVGFCSFVSLYNRDDVESVGLDDAARRLGVERRRIYDIVNVLESVGVRS